MSKTIKPGQLLGEIGDAAEERKKEIDQEGVPSHKIENNPPGWEGGPRVFSPIRANRNQDVGYIAD